MLQLKLNGPVLIFIINHDTDVHRFDRMLNKRGIEVVSEITGEAGSGRVGQSRKLLAWFSQSKKAERILKFWFILQMIFLHAHYSCFVTIQKNEVCVFSFIKTEAMLTWDRTKFKCEHTHTRCQHQIRLPKYTEWIF